MPHQRDGVAFLMDGGIMLTSEPGCGKSAVAVEVVKRRESKAVLVVAPAVLLRNWEREFRLGGSDLKIVDPRREPKRLAEAEVVLLSVDWMRSDAAKKIAHSRVWDVMIVDESHFCSDPEAARTAATFDLTIKAHKVILMTGTPTPKHCANLWPSLNRTAPERIDHMTYPQFVSRYCRVQMKMVGAMRIARPMIVGNNQGTMEELRERLKGCGWRRDLKRRTCCPTCSRSCGR